MTLAIKSSMTPKQPTLPANYLNELQWARAMPAGLAKIASNHQWELAPHLALINRKLLDVAAGRVRRLAVTLPPRHGKSELISKYYPAWYLARFPDRRVILTSYEADFAASWGRKAKEVLQDWGKEIFGIEISEDSSAANRWDIKGHAGGMNTAGVGGPITGKGANLFIIDDPVKNAEESFSKTMRNKAWDWYRSTAYTRLEPNGAIILMMTRWNEDDMAGRILKEMKEGGDRWEIINLPAFAESNDPLGRKPGEALWRDRFNQAELEKIKRALGSYWFTTLYQQRPQAEQGFIFKRQFFRYFTRDGDIYTLETSQGYKKVHANKCAIYQTCDPAASTKTTADYFVLATWARTPDNELLLLDILRTRLEGPDQPNLFKQAYARWHPGFQAVEKNGLGLTLYQTLLREGLPVKELDAEGDKVIRALPAAARMEAGTIYFLKGAAWLADYEDELTTFNKGKHDDQVDVTSYAVQCLVSDLFIEYDEDDVAIEGGGQF